jgi:hypothetical protein
MKAMSTDKAIRKMEKSLKKFGDPNHTKQKALKSFITGLSSRKVQGRDMKLAITIFLFFWLPMLYTALFTQSGHG